MNRAKLIATGVGLGLVAAAGFSFKSIQVTSWVDEQVDPYNVRAVCKTTKMVEVFGKAWISEGPELPKSDCAGTHNFWLTQTPKASCAVDLESLTAKCDEAYEHPFF